MIDAAQTALYRIGNNLLQLSFVVGTIIAFYSQIRNLSTYFVCLGIQAMKVTTHLYLLLASI